MRLLPGTGAVGAIECGPGSVLSGLVRRTLSGFPVVSVHTLEEAGSAVEHLLAKDVAS